jgi:hypothetical protein
MTPLAIFLALWLKASALPPAAQEAPRPTWRWARENEREHWRNRR